VQPGVEFSPTQVHPLPMGRDPALLGALAGWPDICFEAHSTDYQHPEVYPRLAQLGFAFQKVGPALTYAWRAALYDLDNICRDLGGQHGPSLPDVMESVMLAAPAYWQGHYSAAAGDLRHLRHFGLADRIRYYWTAPLAAAAVAQLLADIAALAPRDAALAAYFTDSEIAFARLSLQKPHQTLGRALAMARVQSALRPYFLMP
jgi:D-tagatose-1,6-bisphosphate aldolase subunit GatZ/KbaZ